MSLPSIRRPQSVSAAREGWHGWDDYAQFYDWESAQTVQRRDVGFWQRLADRIGGPVLELGCGTGRVSLPVARTVEMVVGVDRSSEMLDRARSRLRRSKYGPRVKLVRGDIRALPVLDSGPFRLAMAPYGILQSLLRDRDLRETLCSVAGVLQRGGTFGIDLVPELPTWGEYQRRVSLRARRGARGGQLTLIESVRQDRDRGITTFDQEFIERKGARRSSHQFSIAFRTLSIRKMRNRLERAGFDIEAVLGDYRGRAWDSRAQAWIILARRR